MQLISEPLPMYLVVPLVLILGVVAVSIVRRSTGDSIKDPLRAYPSDFRRVGSRRAGDQCEYSTPWFTRCTRTAEHSDHFYPHTRGGATSMRNLVASCPRHNLSKGARMPTTWTRILIQWRRRRYFPAGVDRTVGQWFR